MAGRKAGSIQQARVVRQRIVPRAGWARWNGLQPEAHSLVTHAGQNSLQQSTVKHSVLRTNKCCQLPPQMCKGYPPGLQFSSDVSVGGLQRLQGSRHSSRHIRRVGSCLASRPTTGGFGAAWLVN